MSDDSWGFNRLGAWKSVSHVKQVPSKKIAFACETGSVCEKGFCGGEKHWFCETCSLVG